MTVEEFFEAFVGPLPDSDRLQLIGLILTGSPNLSLLDEGDEWSDEGLREFALRTWWHIEKEDPEEAPLVDEAASPPQD